MTPEERAQLEAQWKKTIESSFEYIVGGLDPALNDSKHADFARASEEYARLLEDTDSLKGTRESLDELLTKLVGVASASRPMLQELLLVPSESDDDDEFRFDEKVCEKDRELRDLLSDRVETWIKQVDNSDGYYTAVHGLLDDLCDLYSDLKRGLMHWKLGTPKGVGAAYFHWHLSPWHWNDHLYRAMDSVQAIRYAEGE